MAKIARFEDIEAWKASRSLARLVYEMTSCGEWARDFGLRDQIRRAAVSVMSNIAEGFDRQGDAEFRRFLAMAKGSAAEVKSQLYLATDLGYLKAEASQAALDQTDTLCRMLGSFMSYLRSSQDTVTRRRGDSPTRRPEDS